LSLRRYGAKRDDNEPKIIQALEAVGASVQRLSEQGCPDILVGYRRQTYLLEIKKGKGKLNDGQALWHRLWRGLPVGVVYTVEDALRAIGAIK
jgi:hypothetical protein